jgi:hypothetical protein
MSLLLILDFHRGINIVFWFWGFCMVCEVNLLMTFWKLLWVLSSLVMSWNENEQRSGVLPFIGVEWVWAEFAACSGGQCDLRRTLAGEGVFEKKRIPVEDGRCIRYQCRCGGGWLDESVEQNSVMRKGEGRGVSASIVIGPVCEFCSFVVAGLQVSMSCSVGGRRLHWCYLDEDPVLLLPGWACPYISRLVGKDLRLLKFDYVIMVESIFGYGWCWNLLPLFITLFRSVDSSNRPPPHLHWHLMHLPPSTGICFSSNTPSPAKVLFKSHWPPLHIANSTPI